MKYSVTLISQTELSEHDEVVQLKLWCDFALCSDISCVNSMAIPKWATDDRVK